MRGSLNSHLQYRLNRMLARGSLLPFALLAMLSILVTAVGMNAWFFGLFSEQGLAAEGIEGDLDRGFRDALMWSVKHVIDPGAFSEDYGAPLPVVLIALTISVLGLAIFGTLIAFISSAVQQRLDAVRRGNTPIFEQGHTLVLGWSNKLPFVLDSLEQTGEKTTVAILAPREIQSMATGLRLRERRGKLDIVLRSGCTSALPDLSRMAIEHARHVVVLAPTAKPGQTSDPDVDTIKTLVLLKAFKKWAGTPPHIAAEIDQRKHADLAKIAGGPDVNVLAASDVISRLLVQCAREPGVSQVYSEIFSTCGSRIQTRAVPEISCARFGDIAQWFPQAVPIGISWHERNGDRLRQASALNPEPDYELDHDEKLILLQSDRHASMDPDILAGPLRKVEPQAPPAQRLSRLCILGWNDNIDEILSELDAHLPQGAYVKILADIDEALMSSYVERHAPAGFRNLELSFGRSDLVDRDSLALHRVLDHDCVIALADYDPQDDPDSRVILQLLLLTDMHRSTGNEKAPHVVVELLDARSRELVEDTIARDIVVSTQIVSAQLAQVAREPGLGPVFRELLSAGGIEIVLRPARNYVPIGKTSGFGAVVLAAQSLGEIALGVVDEEGKVNLNPPKSSSWRFDGRHQVVAMAQQLYT